ncbi:MAG: 4-hydroxy-tetrahydrodipicolinate reductase [Cytophagaceae bacterium]|nr:4-hydroxy-tetrahydrodipicolinate reductase [Cytophagaceae bacterium]
MKILILGYGKMGKTIEQIAINRSHTVPFKIDVNNRQELDNIDNTKVDAAIEFSSPESAYENVKFCIEKNIPVVCGTTGWLEKKKEIEKLCMEKGGAFFYASNYSVGVNLFFHFNKILAKIMKGYPSYEVSMEEIHHTEKKDAPSGTAITLAEGVLESYTDKKKWVNQETKNKAELSIISKRIEKVPGTHTIFYNSPVDTIEIRHTAHSRQGFAEGAVIAAEWLKGKRGVFGMDDMLKVTY